MFYKESLGEKVFNVANIIFLTAVTLMGILPFLHLLAISLSSNSAAMAGEVYLWPVNFTTVSYQYLAENAEFFASLWVTIQRVFLGTLLNMLLIIFTAYPLSRSNKQFRFRTIYVWFFVVTMFFGGGLIPTYMVVRATGILDTLWALILPGALNVFFMVMLLNFFRNIPKELEEAAIVDGAGHWTMLFRIFLPISLPSIATILLFTIVNHWNSWFDGILYMNSPANYPLQSYLSTLVTSINVQAISVEELSMLQQMGEKTLRTAQIFMGILPVLLVYPFLQKYFIKGITVGSVKE
ncbi:carbohydrate ABC transporter permease [Gracilibacillus alcaliphilus]|uniref:carbohydrate ABC transporter permease n=1 Tax=Gracilibacillus alcaliphilus TaxID=1401441 RepID=UPI00195CE3A9|nr:carbohydrate ABC transporter permease [Gracilibacillus alcaliphilus]MBM7679062.1 putative aldouronate transport system permease protein [Gracilibacillus alcaliphilus]